MFFLALTVAIKKRQCLSSFLKQERDELSLTSTFTTIRNKLNTFMLNQIVMKSTVDVTAFVPLTPQIVSRLGQTDTSNASIVSKSK